MRICVKCYLVRPESVNYRHFKKQVYSFEELFSVFEKLYKSEHLVQKYWSTVYFASNTKFLIFDSDSDRMRKIFFNYFNWPSSKMSEKFLINNSCAHYNVRINYSLMAIPSRNEKNKKVSTELLEILTYNWIQ